LDYALPPFIGCAHAFILGFAAVLAPAGTHLDGIQAAYAGIFVKAAAVYAAFNGLLVALVKQYAAPPHWNYTISMGRLSSHYLANGWDARRWMAPVSIVKKWEYKEIFLIFYFIPSKGERRWFVSCRILRFHGAA
jgi:hypothetical protein